MQWRKYNPDNFYQGEVLAINALNDMIVGYLTNRAFCSSEQEVLTNVTHYMPAVELIELKIQLTLIPHD